MRKKRVQNLDGRQRSLVENALYYANPPETPQIIHVSLPPMLQYIQKLLYKDLNKNNTEKVREREGDREREKGTEKGVGRREREGGRGKERE